MTRRLEILAVAIIFASLGGGTGAARAAETPPAITIVGPDKPSLRIVKANGGRAAKVLVFARATGNDAVDGTFSLLLPEGQKIEGAKERFEAGAARGMELTFEGWPDGPSPKAVFLQAASTGSPPALVAVVPQRTVERWNLWLPILVALGAAVVAATVIAVRALHGPRSLEDSVVTEATWKWNDSWATNITAIGAIAATVLASSGFLQDVFPDLPVGRFTGLALLFGGAVIIAPTVYLGFGRTREEPVTGGTKKVTPVGTVASLVLATGVTLWGVFGHLALMGMLVGLADATALEKGFLWAILVSAAVMVAIYAVRTTGWLASLATKDDATVQTRYIGGALI